MSRPSPDPAGWAVSPYILRIFCEGSGSVACDEYLTFFGRHSRVHEHHAVLAVLWTCLFCALKYTVVALVPNVPLLFALQYLPCSCVITLSSVLHSFGGPMLTDCTALGGRNHARGRCPHSGHVGHSFAQHSDFDHLDGMGGPGRCPISAASVLN